MGGSRSGRYAIHPTVESTGSLVLSAKSMKGVPDGLKGEVTLRFGEYQFPVAVEVDTSIQSAPYLAVRHAKRRDGDESLVSYSIELARTTPRFGGQRWWFRCPRSGRRVAKLFLPLGGSYFWSRQAYGLRYSSQREAYHDRMVRKGRKLNRKLGGDGDDEVPPKPKWMRWRTYEKHLEVFDKVSEAIDSQFLVRAVTLLRRRGK